MVSASRMSVFSDTDTEVSCWFDLSYDQLKDLASFITDKTVRAPLRGISI